MIIWLYFDFISWFIQYKSEQISLRDELILKQNEHFDALMDPNKKLKSFEANITRKTALTHKKILKYS